MAVWQNGDGLSVRFGPDEGDLAVGGQVSTYGMEDHYTFLIRGSDVVSATDAILGSAVAANSGSLGVLIPKGARIKAIETVVKTVFASTGTIGTSTLLIGLIKASDRSTELDFNGFTTASFASTAADLDVVGARKYVTVGSTGAGALIGTTLAENGYISVSNSQHSGHPFGALGVLEVTLITYTP